nr:MAG TPA: hypothetical protein [Caudoviricetes sp.]
MDGICPCCEPALPFLAGHGVASLPPFSPAGPGRPGCGRCACGG